MNGWEEKAIVTAALEWSRCRAGESIVFKATRMPVATVFENLQSGATVEEIMEWFDVTREQIQTVLEFRRPLPLILLHDFQSMRGLSDRAPDWTSREQPWGGC